MIEKLNKLLNASFLEGKSIKTAEKSFKHQELLQILKKDFQLDYHGDHGVIHWSNVFQNCNRLANYYQIDSRLFEYFALIHDCKRMDELEDFGHGPNAAIYCDELYEDGKLDLNKEELKHFKFICHNHSSLRPGQTSDLITQICIDADRLDLSRFGGTIKKEYLFTDHAKKMADDINENNPLNEFKVI